MKRLARSSNVCEVIFEQQPQRARVIAMIMDAERIQVLLVTRDAPDSVQRTPLLPFTLAKRSPGFLALCHVLNQSLEQLGFLPAAVPQCFEDQPPWRASGRGGQLCLSSWRAPVGSPIRCIPSFVHRVSRRSCRR